MSGSLLFIVFIWVIIQETRILISFKGGLGSFTKRGALAGLTLATGGWQSNLIVYLIEVFNVKSINAAQISNITNGCTNLFPVIGAIVADSFLGSFSVAAISACISLLGIVLLTLTTTLDPLRPHPCDNGSSLCTPPSTVQYAVLYTGLALACIGSGVSNTVIVYIEDNVSWRLGFGLSAITNFIALALFLFGNRFYLHDKPQGSPFTGLVRVIVATIRKWKAKLSSNIEDYYFGHDGIAGIAPTTKKSFRFLNRAALKTEGDIGSDGLIAKPWRICTIQQGTKIHPLWGIAQLFMHPRYMHGKVVKIGIPCRIGGGTSWIGSWIMHLVYSSELGVYVYAAAQVKKAMEVGTLLIEPKPHEPTKHQYDWDAATSANFLRKYGLEGKLKFTTFIGGLAPGGFNFDAKLRRESTDVEDLFIAHITGMDTLARGLRNVAKLIEVTSHKDQKQYWARENEPYSIVIVNEFAEAFQSFHEGRRLQDELAIPFDKSKIHPAAQTNS
uniref:xylose isomerase n=1 Tax=Fagus sylvatica TaxID=28930 RepID=A0A2N9HZZ7_FAGSY